MYLLWRVRLETELEERKEKKLRKGGDQPLVKDSKIRSGGED